MLASLQTQPGLYKRYVDDICVQVEDLQELEALKCKFEDNSVLKFTYEVELDNKLHFLDVDVSTANGSFSTKVYRKPTDIGRCMNARSACPTRYKTGVIRTYVQRALSHCSTWELVHQELQHVKQMLVNNGYSCTDIDAEINRTLDKHRTREHKTQSSEKSQVHKVFYMNHMNDAYDKDEKVLKNILKKNVVPKEGHEVKLVVYYKSLKTSNLVIRNRAKRECLQETNVVYRYNCQKGDCKLRDTSSYIGSTTMTLSRRLSYHLSAGGPADHSRNTHGERITRQEMVDNTSILARQHNQRKLRIVEAAYILEYQPAMCDQVEHRGRITLLGRTPGVREG